MWFNALLHPLSRRLRARAGDCAAPARSLTCHPPAGRIDRGQLRALSVSSVWPIFRAPIRGSSSSTSRPSPARAWSETEAEIKKLEDLVRREVDPHDLRSSSPTSARRPGFPRSTPAIPPRTPRSSRWPQRTITRSGATSTWTASAPPCAKRCRKSAPTSNRAAWSMPC